MAYTIGYMEQSIGTNQSPKWLISPFLLSGINGAIRDIYKNFYI